MVPKFLLLKNTMLLIQISTSQDLDLTKELLL